MRALFFICLLAPSVSAVSFSDVLARFLPSVFGAPKEPGSLEGEVAVLTDENWDEAKAQSHERDWLVEFYAPWCGHCKALAPIYLEAASKIDTLRFAKIDATKYSDLRDSLGVKGFPTVFWMRKGQLNPFSGAKTLEGFEKLAARLSNPPVTFVETAKHLQEELDKDKSVKFALSANQNDDSSLTKVFQTAASRSHDEITFLHSTPAVIAESLQLPEKVPTPAVLRVESGDTAAVFPFSADKDLYAWVHQNKYATVVELTRINYHTVTASGRVTVLALCNSSDRAAFVTEFSRIKRGAHPEVTKEQAKLLQFATMSAQLTGLERFLSQFGLDNKDLPLVIALDNKDRKYWYTGTGNPEGVAEFVLGLQDGSIETHFMGRFAFVQKAWSILTGYFPFLSVLDFMPQFSILITLGVLGSIYLLCDGCCCRGDDDDDTSSDDHQKQN